MHKGGESDNLKEVEFTKDELDYIYTSGRKGHLSPVNDDIIEERLGFSVRGYGKQKGIFCDYEEYNIVTIPINIVETIRLIEGEIALAPFGNHVIVYDKDGIKDKMPVNKWGIKLNLVIPSRFLIANIGRRLHFIGLTQWDIDNITQVLNH